MIQVYNARTYFLVGLFSEFLEHHLFNKWHWTPTIYQECNGVAWRNCWFWHQRVCIWGRGACKPAIQSEGSKCWTGGQAALNSDLYPAGPGSHLGWLHLSKPSLHRLVSSVHEVPPWSPQRCLAQKSAQKSPFWSYGSSESTWKSPHLKNRRTSQTLIVSATEYT